MYYMAAALGEAGSVYSQHQEVKKLESEALS